MNSQHDNESKNVESDADASAPPRRDAFSDSQSSPPNVARNENQLPPNEDSSSANSSRASQSAILPDENALRQQVFGTNAVVVSDVPSVSESEAAASTRTARSSALNRIVRKVPARVLTALIGIPIVIAIVWIGGAWLTGVTVFLALVAMRELIIAARRSKAPLVIEWCYFLLLFSMISLWQTMSIWREAAGTGSGFLLFRFLPTLLQLAWPLLMLLFVPLWLLLWAIMRYEKHRVTLSSVALSTLAINYVALFAFLPMLRDAPNGLSLFVLLLAGVWTGDTAAYYAGRAFGRYRLTALSPGKTREGVLVGVFATFLVCLLLAEPLKLDLVHEIAIGILISVFAPLGDLIESFWKRELGTKDLGSILPGHGGVLDRCDSLLLAAPAVFVYALWQNL